jgi:NAD(P)-dependent dehydrogenase (short-subunit alcohol dehydrogenase family)
MPSEPAQRAAQRAIVTGGANGIGRAIADRLLLDGARVMVVDLDVDAVQDFLASHPDEGARVAAETGDVADPAVAQAVVDAVVGQWGGLEILVNCAGRSRYEHVLDITVESWRSIIETNLSGCFFWSRAAAQVMAGAGFGRIINIASVNSVAAEPRTAHYAASKGGIAALTRAFAVDLGSIGITVNAIAPGPILTDRNSHLFDAEPLRSQLKRVPVGHGGTPADVTEAVAWLAGPATGFVNGHTLVVDGGLLARI